MATIRIYYVATGPVRGDCGHRHRTLTAAMRCVDRDARACAKLGGRLLGPTTIRRSDGSYIETEPGDHGEGCCVSELDVQPGDAW